MPAGYQDLYLEQGTTFNTQLTLTDNTNAAYNLVGFSVFSQAKKSYYSSTPAITFNTTISDASNGVITISANSAVTANVSAIQKLVYDVRLTDNSSNNVSRVLEGQIFVSPGVTK
jgi:hypothetical protein